MSDFLNPHLTRPAVRWTSGDALPAVEQTGPAAPLLVDSTTGRLLVDTEANLSADLSSIESKMDTANGIATTTAADLAAVKTQLATGTIAVTGGGGGGGGGASAAYNATLPTYTSGASTTLQTDQNGRLITTGDELATIATEAVAIDGKLPALSSGRVPVEANNAASEVYNYTASGNVSANTVLMSFECARFREIIIHGISFGAGCTVAAEISNNNIDWVGVPYQNVTAGGASTTSFSSTNNIYSVLLHSARFFRLRQANSQTSGTTTLVAYASQQATPKLYQQVSGTVLIGGTLPPTSPSANNGGFTTFHTLVSAATTNATNVKSAGGQIGSLSLTNNSASWAYFKLCNTSTAPTPGTTTAIINIGVPPNTTLDCSTSYAGLRMSTGISYYVSAGTSLTDNTALPAAGTFLVNMTFS